MNASFVLQPGNAELEPRRGDPPLTTRPNREQPFPHQQLTQTAPIELQQELFARVLTLPGLSTGDSCVSVPGARAFILDPAVAAGPAAAFLCETEFAHLHPPGDGSLHIALPPDVYRGCKPPVGVSRIRSAAPCSSSAPATGASSKSSGRSCWPHTASPLASGQNPRRPHPPPMTLQT